MERSPVGLHQAACLVDGIHTEVVINRFEDANSIMVTQTKRIGSMYRVTRDGLGESEKPSFTVTNLLGGVEDPTTDVFVRQLALALSSSTEAMAPQVIVWLSLQTKTPAAMKSIVQFVQSVCGK
eukprot:m.9275 g.9275  ORF g.9275 m.9275 type:complete len:124 (-) comp4681_c0_seq1:245-616(-)